MLDETGEILHYVATVRSGAGGQAGVGAGHATGARPNPPATLAARDRLALAEQRTRELVEQVPAIFYEEALAAEGETFYVSPQIEQILGVSPAEYRTHHDWWREHLHADDRDRMIAEYEARLTDPSLPPSSSC